MVPVRGERERNERLLSHVKRGWARTRKRPELGAMVLRWLEEHPAGWEPVQEIWVDALQGEGPVYEWLEAGARPDSWQHPIPLHSILSSHPFASLPRWSSPLTSSGS